jgi:hypothetical protein
MVRKHLHYKYRGFEVRIVAEGAEPHDWRLKLAISPSTIAGPIIMAPSSDTFALSILDHVALLVVERHGPWNEIVGVCFDCNGIYVAR